LAQPGLSGLSGLWASAVLPVLLGRLAVLRGRKDRQARKVLLGSLELRVLRALSVPKVLQGLLVQLVPRDHKVRRAFRVRQDQPVFLVLRAPSGLLVQLDRKDSKVHKAPRGLRVQLVSLDPVERQERQVLRVRKV
jgi:hypothetical protein